MTTTLITGGNKGLGREAARRLKEAGHDVVIGARDAAKGRATAEELGVDFVEVDVTSDESVARAAEQIRARGGLDVLVNNAGIAGGLVKPLDVDGPTISRVLDTNTVGVVRMVHVFAPILAESDNPLVVNVASGLGSFTARADESRPEHGLPTLAYSASKVAVTMMTTIYAESVPQIRFLVVDPGPSATDLNGGRGAQTVTEGTDAIVTAATTGPDGPTGTFTDRHGVLGW